LAIQVGARNRLVTILVVKEERHRSTWSKPIRQGDWHAQILDPSDPPTLDQVRNPKVHVLENQFIIRRTRINMFMMPERCPHAQVGSAPNGLTKQFGIPPYRQALLVQFERNFPHREVLVSQVPISTTSPHHGARQKDIFFTADRF